MPAAALPEISASHIPNIKTLRKELGYGNPKQIQYRMFYEYTSFFQKMYKTSNGTLGLELHNWRSEATQIGLSEMTTAFLEDEGNGSIFWHDERSSEYYNTLQYSKHSMKIMHLMKQLFFRMNLQNYRNQKYKRNQSGEDEITVNGYEVHEVTPVSQNAERMEGQHKTATSTPTTLEGFHSNSGGEETIISNVSSRMIPSESVEQPATSKRPGNDDISVPHANKRQKILHHSGPHRPYNLAAFSEAMEQGRSSSPNDEKACHEKSLLSQDSTIIVRVDNPVPQVNSTTPDSSPPSQLTGPDDTISRVARVHSTRLSSDPHSSCRDNRTPLGPIIISRDESGRSGYGSKRSAKFIYRVVLSRPRRVTKRWDPRGNFKDKSLGDLLKELPLTHDGIEGFTFAFENPHMRMVEYIPKYDEDGFESMKRCVDRLVKELLQLQVREGVKDPRLVTDVLIEGGDGRDNDLYDRMEETSLEW